MDGCVKEGVKAGGLWGLSTASFYAGSSLALKGVGFTTGGVAAKSYAALWMSSIGNVAAGSTFSALQSIGVLGLSTGTVATVAFVPVVVYYGYKYSKGKF